ncbi:ABC transporter permease [Bacteriovorax sp. Seq25_V]|uniref:ABC transporter permease n=1 Tax=Bacteriovorax sp. Seq25_V TaxID=1201288 RepID=UPI00038A4F2C|nr:ABC transporter permease [Bacteriovorax sp. Seq25_V]EQC47448.1 MacB-like periplasmic core domain protein [Bacteriovorax sp. Seq25_V]
MKFFNLLKDFNLLFFRDRSSKIFAFATILGLAFSISIVLSTLGLMDGFSKKLKESLNEGHGEIVLTSRRGFFSRDDRDLQKLSSQGINKFAFMVRTQSFLTSNQKGKAVFVVGIDDTFSAISENIKAPATDEVIIGSELAKNLDLQVGDPISLTFAAGRAGESYLPSIGSFTVAQIYNFNIHQFDERYVYANLETIQNKIQVGNNVNLVKLKLDVDKQNVDAIDEMVKRLRSIFFLEFEVQPYWGDFATFLRAVDYEKYLISLVLYIVIVIAAFNCLAFIVYSKEKKAQEIFLLYAIGLSPRKFKNLWYIQNSFIWFISFLVSLLFVEFFSYAIANWEIFKLPSDVYILGRIEVNLTLKYILITALSSYMLLFFLTFLILKRLDGKSLGQGLREEFS